MRTKFPTGQIWYGHELDATNCSRVRADDTFYYTHTYLTFGHVVHNKFIDT